MLSQKYITHLWLFIISMMLPVIAQAAAQVQLEASCNPLEEVNVVPLGGTVNVCFSLKGFDTPEYQDKTFDLYLGVSPPQEDSLWFISTSGTLFKNQGLDFHEVVAPYLAQVKLSNGKGVVFDFPLPSDINMVGEYKFYAIVVAAGETEVFNAKNWVGNLAQTLVLVTRL